MKLLHRPYRAKELSRSALALCCVLLAPNFAHADTDYNYAKGLYDKKLYGLAAQSLRDFLKEKPTDANAKIASYQLGAALYRTEDSAGKVNYAEVVKAYETAITRYPDPKLTPAAQLELGDAYFQLGQNQKSLDAYTAFLKSNPPAAQAAEANYWVGENQTALKRPALAKAAYQKVLADYPTSDIAPYAQYSLGLLAVDANDNAGAAAAFKAVTTKYPKSDIAPESRLRLGDALLAQKKWAEASAAYQVTLNDPLAKDWQTDAAQGLADAAFGAKSWEAAAKGYAQILGSLKPDDARRKALQLRLADSYFNGKQWQAAVDAYTPIIGNGDAKTVPTALYYSAGALNELGKLPDAAARYRRIVDEFPKDALAAKASLRLGDVLAANKDAKGAATAYKLTLTRYAGTDAAREAQEALVDLAGEAGTNKGSGADVEEVVRSLPAGPASSNAQLRLAQVAYNQSDWKKAANLANAALAAKPNAATAENAAYLLASAKLNDGDSNGAATAFHSQLQKFPTGALSGEARLGLAWALLDAKQWKPAQDAARTALAPASKIKPALKPQLQLALGEALWRGGNAKEALPVLAVVETNPSPDIASQAAYNAALALEATKSWGAAATKWGNYAAKSSDAEEKARGFLRQGLALSNAKNATAAIAAFDRSIAAAPKGQFAARALYESAWAAHDAKQSGQETARWQRLAADYADSPYASEAAFQQGEALFAAKKWDEASSAYRTVTEKYPQSDSAGLAWYQLGAALYNTDKFAEAATAFDEAAAFPKSEVAVESLFWSGESYRRAGALGEAQARYEKFLANPKANPKLTPTARLGLGQSYAANNDWTRAISTYEAGSKGATGNTAAELEFRLGEALAATGKDKDAAAHFLKVSISYPQSQWANQAQWDAAQSLEKSGDKTGALELYRALATATPTNDLTAQAQDKVKALGG